MKISDFLTEDGLKALKHIRGVLEPIWDTSSSDWHLPDREKRITFSLTRSPANGNFALCLHVDQEDSWAERKAKEIERSFPGIVSWSTVGEAQSAYPELSTFAPHSVSGELRPGVCISHGRFSGGSLGCIVKIQGDDGDYTGVATAAHVIALNQSAKTGDTIYSPGKGSVPRILRRHEIGRLTDSLIELYPINETGEENAAEDVTIDVDIAITKLSENGLRRHPLTNTVPHPHNPIDDSLNISNVVPEAEIPGLLLQPVYKYGAVSGFTRGKLTNALIDRRILRLPNRKQYLYKELFAVAPDKDDSSPFSRPGDSGSIIYTEDGRLIGFVVGADQHATFGCFGERTLSAVNARLI